MSKEQFQNLYLINFYTWGGGGGSNGNSVGKSEGNFRPQSI